MRAHSFWLCAAKDRFAGITYRSIFCSWTLSNSTSASWFFSTRRYKTKEKVSLECILNKEDHFVSKAEQWMRVFNFAFWKPYSFQNFNSVRIGWSWFGTLALHPWIAELVMFTHNKRNVQSLNACNLRVFDYGSSNTLQPIIYRCYLVVVFLQNTYPPNGRQLD